MTKLAPLILLLTFLTACGAPAPHRSGLRDVEPVIDGNLTGTWLIKKAELGGKDFQAPGFELQIAGDQYRAGTPPPADRGKLVLFGDELAGEARRMDVVGESGPNKGKRLPAIFRMSSNNRELEICYDLAGKERPGDFVSREGTQTLRVTYAKK